MSKWLDLVDIDGVLADTRHRDEHALNRDWGTYFSLMHLDGVWAQGVELVENVEICGADFAYLTGRREDTRHVTKRWLKKSGFPKAPLIMRRRDDRQPLAHLKAGVVADALLIYPGRVRLWDDDPWVIEEVCKVNPIAGRHCTWYIKPSRIVRRASA